MLPQLQCKRSVDFRTIFFDWLWNLSRTNTLNPSPIARSLRISCVTFTAYADALRCRSICGCWIEILRPNDETTTTTTTARMMMMMVPSGRRNAREEHTTVAQLRTHVCVCLCVCRWAKRQMDDGEERWIKTKYGQYEGPGHGGRHDTRGLHENKTNNYGCNLSELSPTTHLKTKKEPKLIKR